MEEKSNWKTELAKIKPCAQRQDSMTEQLIDLCIIADLLGFYDASDYIKEKLGYRTIKL